MNRSDADIHKKRANGLLDPDYQDKLDEAKREVARKAKLYYVHIDDWDFSRDEHMKSIVRAENEVQIEEKYFKKEYYPPTKRPNYKVECPIGDMMKKRVANGSYYRKIIGEREPYTEVFRLRLVGRQPNIKKQKF